METTSIRAEEITRDWYLVDANNQTLGRLASRVAQILRGKNKPYFTPHMDMGDFVVIINAEKVKVTGNKATDKIYHSHSGYPGGLKSISFEKLQERSPEKVIKLAVKGMLPRTPLGRAMFKKLKVYAGTDHPHGAQQPKTVTL